MLCRAAQVRLVTQFQTRLDIAILPPYTPSPEERADPKLYAANVRALYGRAMGLPLVEQARPYPRIWTVARTLAKEVTIVHGNVLGPGGSGASVT